MEDNLLFPDNCLTVLLLQYLRPQSYFLPCQVLVIDECNCLTYRHLYDYFCLQMEVDEVLIKL